VWKLCRILWSDLLASDIMNYPAASYGVSA